MGPDASDAEIVLWAESTGAVVVSKDNDFRMLQLATGKPSRLLVIATGNIGTAELLDLTESRLGEIEQALLTAQCVQLHRTMLVVDTG